LSKWIATLEGLKQQVLEKTKINPAKVEVIPLPLDLEKFNQPSLSQTEAREKLQLPLDVNIMGVIGRIDPKKGQQFVIQALAKIKNWHLLVLGEPTRGEYENHLEELRQMVVKLRLEERVHFRPFTQNLSPVYKSLNLMVMATQAETFGAVTIEAMASEIPVLGTNSGGTPEILENGKLGFLYEPNNQKSFLQVFEEFNNNNELVAQKVGLARQAAKLKYDEKAVLKQFLDVLG
jgi:glycosyltransferase involved in cell wall biosynthesis